MSTNAYLSNLLLELKDTTVSPNAYRALEEVTGGANVGETAPLVRVTHFQSTSEEYIAGLADGDEFTAECNATHVSPSVQQEFIALKGLTRTVRVSMFNTSVSPNTVRRFEFDCVFLGWTLAPEVGGADKLTFNFKISGGIARTEV